MGSPVDYKSELARFDRSLSANKLAQVKNVARLRNVPHPHTAAMCRVMSSLIDGFADKNLLALVEAEILKLGAHARPEDIVIWIDGVGVLVIEVKSHRIEGIRSFENNVPQVIYHGERAADVGLLDQPKDFAYKLKGPLEQLFEDEDIPVPPLYYVGWLPFVSLFDVQQRGQEVVPERVWFSDSLGIETMQSRLESMKNMGLSGIPKGFSGVKGLHRCESTGLIPSFLFADNEEGEETREQPQVAEPHFRTPPVARDRSTRVDDDC